VDDGSKEGVDTERVGRREVSSESSGIEAEVVRGWTIAYDG
jgi:hypothetical protein